MKKKWGMIMLGLLLMAVAQAQTPIDKIFKKYNDTKGVSITSQSTPVTDSVTNKTFTVNSRLLSVEGKEHKDMVQQLYAECEKALAGYTVVLSNKDDDTNMKIVKLDRGDALEMVVLTKEPNDFTLVVVQGKGLTADMKKRFQQSFKYNKNS